MVRDPNKTVMGGHVPPEKPVIPEFKTSIPLQSARGPERVDVQPSLTHGKDTSAPSLTAAPPVADPRHFGQPGSVMNRAATAMGTDERMVGPRISQAIMTPSESIAPPAAPPPPNNMDKVAAIARKVAGGDPALMSQMMEQYARAQTQPPTPPETPQAQLAPETVPPTTPEVVQPTTAPPVLPPEGPPEAPLGPPEATLGPPEAPLGPPEAPLGPPEAPLGPPESQLGPPEADATLPGTGFEGGPKGVTSPFPKAGEDKSRWTDAQLKWFQDAGMYDPENDDFYGNLSMLGNIQNPAAYLDEQGKFDKGKWSEVQYDVLAKKNTMRATDPSFVMDEFETFMSSPIAREMQLDHQRMINAMSKGGASFAGRPRIDAARATTDFNKSMMDMFSDSLKQQDKLFLATGVESGRLSTEQAKVLSQQTQQRHEKAMEILKQGGKATEAEKERTFKAAESEKTRSHQTAMEAAGITAQTERDSARFAHEAGMQDKDIIAESNRRKEEIKAGLDEARISAAGKKDTGFDMSTKLSETREKIINRVQDSRLTKKLEPGEREALTADINESWGRQAFALEYPDATNVQERRKGGKRVLVGQAPDGGLVQVPLEY